MIRWFVLIFLFFVVSIVADHKPDLRTLNYPSLRKAHFKSQAPVMIRANPGSNHVLSAPELTPLPAVSSRIKTFFRQQSQATILPANPQSGTIWFLKGPFIYVNSATWALMMLQTDTELSDAKVYYGYTITDNILYYDQVRDGMIDHDEGDMLVEFNMDELQTNSVVYFVMELTDKFGQIYNSYIYYFVSNTQEITQTYLLYEPSLISNSDSMSVIGFVSDLPAPGVIQLEYYQNTSKKYFYNTEKDYDYTHFVLIPEDYLDYLANPNTGHYLAPNTLFNYKPGLYFSIWNKTITWDYKTFQLKTLPQPDGNPPKITYGPVVFSYKDLAYIYLETDELSFSILYYYTSPDVAHSTPIGSATSLYYGQYQLFELTGLNPNQTYYYMIYIFDLRSSIAYYFSNGNHLLWSNITIWPNLNQQAYTASPAYRIQPGCFFQPPGNNNNSFSTSTAADETAPQLMAGPTIVDKNSSGVILYWKSDEPSQATLFYATQSNMSDMVSKSTARFDINQWMTLSNLTADMIYYYQIRIDDINGNERWMPETGKPLYVFKTLNTNNPQTAKQITPTEITDLGNQVYLFEWQTDRPCNSTVELTENQNNWTTCSQQIPVSRHQLIAASLKANSTYYYRTTNAAFDNQILTSSLKSFNTSSASSPGALQFLQNPTSTYNSNHAGIVEWTTSEPASSFIEYSSNNQDWMLFNDDKKTTQHKMILQNLKSNTLYAIKAYSVDYAGREIGRTDLMLKTSTSQDLIAPAFPRNPVLKKEGLNYSFSWNSVNDPDIRGYALYSGATASSLTRIASGIVDTSYSENSATSNLVYGISAYDLEDNESPISLFKTVGIDEQEKTRHQLSLINYPNPFNTITTISFQLDTPMKVRLALYNLAGEKLIQLVDGEMPAGLRQVMWNSRDEHDQPVATGLYFYCLETEQQICIRKMILLK